MRDPRHWAAARFPAYRDLSGHVGAGNARRPACCSPSRTYVTGGVSMATIRLAGPRAARFQSRARRSRLHRVPTLGYRAGSLDRSPVQAHRQARSSRVVRDVRTGRRRISTSHRNDDLGSCSEPRSTCSPRTCPPELAHRHVGSLCAGRTRCSLQRRTPGRDDPIATIPSKPRRPPRRTTTRPLPMDPTSGVGSRRTQLYTTCSLLVSGPAWPSVACTDKLVTVV